MNQSLWYREEIRWACQILNCICWKWADFYSFYFLKLNLLINTNVRISVLLGQKRPLWFMYLISDYSVALCRRLGFDRFNRSRVRIYFVIVFYTRFGLLAHVSLAEVICFSNFFLKNSTDAFKIPTVEVEGYKNFNYSTLRDLRETIESALCVLQTYFWISL